MQLGELQSQIDRFTERGVSVIAVSVDLPDDSRAMVERLGLTFDLGSDPDQRLVRSFGIQNPQTRELALHAVYIVDEEGKAFYRKVARRRPTSEELIDAIDAFRGVYPQQDRADEPRQRIAVAYPENNFQALIEMSAVAGLPTAVSQVDFDRVSGLMRDRRGDDALIAFRSLARNDAQVSQDDLFLAAAWLARSVFLDGNDEAIQLGTDLARRVARVAELDSAWRSARGTEAEDELLQQLTRARAGLARVRASVSANAAAWNLRFAKSVLRSYREVARAARRT